MITSKKKETKSIVNKNNLGTKLLTNQEINNVARAKEIRIFLIFNESRNLELTHTDQNCINLENSLFNINFGFYTKMNFYD